MRDFVITVGTCDFCPYSGAVIRASGFRVSICVCHQCLTLWSKALSTTTIKPDNVAQIQREITERKRG